MALTVDPVPEAWAAVTEHRARRELSKSAMPAAAGEKPKNGKTKFDQN